MLSAGVGGAIGSGTLGVATTYASESQISNSVAVGDLNGDGVLDLVTAGLTDGNDGYATVRLGLGNGSFEMATSYAAESLSSRAVALGDLNGDGTLDLVTAGAADGNDGYATVRLGIGNGNFGAATSYAGESFVSISVTLGDLNGDGVLDLVTAGRADGNDGFATVRLGLGNVMRCRAQHCATYAPQMKTDLLRTTAPFYRALPVNLSPLNPFRFNQAFGTRGQP